MIVGSRKGQKETNRLRKLGKNIIRFLAKRLMLLNIHDINSGMKNIIPNWQKNMLRFVRIQWRTAILYYLLLFTKNIWF
jgi:hypothetical protein